MEPKILGVDLGGVIVQSYRNPNAEDAVFAPYVQAQEIMGAFVTLRRCNDFFFDDIHVVSKCGELVEELSREWLTTMHFTQLTHIPEANWHFCRSREDKGVIATALGLTHFIDDRFECLGYMPDMGIGHRFAFNPNPEEQVRAINKLGFDRFRTIHIVHSWEQILTAIAAEAKDEEALAAMLERLAEQEQ